MRLLKPEAERKKKKELRLERDYKCEDCGNSFSSHCTGCEVKCPKCKSTNYRFASNRNGVLI